MTYTDPPEPPEADEKRSMRAADLKNKVCLFRPVELGEWPARPATETERAQDARPYVECDVWVLDRAGIVEEGTNVRVSWWRAVAQLKDRIGQYVLAMPVEQDDRSVILVKTSKKEWRDVATTAVTQLDIGATVVTSSEEDDALEEPF